MADIKISWTSNPQGQIGPRPQKIKVNETCYFTSPDAGDLVVDFGNASPLASGKTIARDVAFIPQKTGRFPFSCMFTPPGGKPMKIDGGEIDIGN